MCALIYVYTYVCSHVCTMYIEVRKGVLDPPELVLHVFVSRSTLLEPNTGPHRTVCSFNY